MRKTLGVLALILAMAPARADIVGAQGSPAADSGYFQIVRPVAKGVWVLAQPKFQVQPDGNVTVIEQRDGYVLFDAGGSRGSGERIVKMVRALGPKPVKAVIVSQWHGDKPQGLSEILKAWPNARTISTALTQAHLSDPATMNTPAAPDAAANGRYQALIKATAAQMSGVAAKAGDATMRRRYEELARVLGQWALDMDGALTTSTREAFTDKLVIADPDRPVEALYLGRANTDGDAVVWLPKQRIAVAGEDVILPFPYGFESYPSDWIAALGRLRALKYKVLIPGHGMPQTDTKQLDRIVAALKDVRAQMAPLAKQGLTLEQATARIDLNAQARIFVGDDPWLRTWFKSFFADPIAVSAYKEAKGLPIVQGLKG
jgi:glyoxylase-like metal-dependent hydrolase (beta-lactamase superfamily II)